VRPTHVLVFFAVVTAGAPAALAVSAGDATYAVDAFGRSTAFTAGPHGDALYELKHAFTFNGAPLEVASGSKFSTDQALTTLGAGKWTSTVSRSGRIQVRFDGELVNASDADGLASAVISVTITNISAATATVDHVVHMDLDANSGFGGDTAQFQDDGTGRVEQSDGGELYRLRSDRAVDAWLIGTYPNVRNAVADGATVSLLGQTGSPTGPADAETAMQWRMQLAPGASTTHTLTLSSVGASLCNDPTPVLPDLTVWADEGLGYMYGSYLDTETIPGRTLLRIATATANEGAGALELRGKEAVGELQTVDQRIYHADGCFEDVKAGEFEYHPSHGHIHFDGWGEYRLHEITASGGAGAVVAKGDKVSFCVLDVAAYNTDLPNAPSNPVYGGCNQFQGLSVGWADVYAAFLPDQYIDITDISPCSYWLAVEVDPENKIVESDETNNITRILVDLGDECGAPVTCTPACDDGLFCNGQEACVAGVCQSGPAPCSGGQTCDEGSDSCVGCLTNAQCDNGFFCDGAESCVAGQCTVGTTPCPPGTCNEAGDNCVQCFLAGDCDDGLFCNGAEDCLSGTCQPGLNPCPGTSCDESSDTCITSSECLTDADCDDGRFCTGAETCSAGACVAGSWPCGFDWCLELFDICATCISDSECDDGVFCNGAEICGGAFTCEAGSNPCSGSCNESGQTCAL